MRFLLRFFIAKIISVLLLLLIIAGAIVYFNLNRIVRTTIETQSTASLNLQTTLKSANLALLGGSLSLDDLAIASPKGFAAPHMLALDEGSVQVSFGQLRKDPIHIDALTLKQPKVVIEQSGGKFNFQTLMDMPPSSSEPVKVIIDKLTITDATVVLRPGLPGLETELAVKVPKLELNQIGTGDGHQNGAAIKEVALQVITSLAARTNAANLPKELQAALEKNVNQVAAKLGGQLQKELGKITDGLKGTDLGNKLGGELNNLLGGAKKEEPKPSPKRK